MENKKSKEHHKRHQKKDDKKNSNKKNSNKKNSNKKNSNKKDDNKKNSNKKDDNKNNNNNNNQNNQNNQNQNQNENHLNSERSSITKKKKNNEAIFKKKYSRLPKFALELKSTLFDPKHQQDQEIKARTKKETKKESKKQSKKKSKKDIQKRILTETETETKTETETETETQTEPKNSFHLFSTILQSRLPNNEILQKNMEKLGNPNYYVLRAFLEYVYTGYFSLPVFDPNPDIKVNTFQNQYPKNANYHDINMEYSFILTCQLYCLFKDFSLDEPCLRCQNYILNELETKEFIHFDILNQNQNQNQKQKQNQNQNQNYLIKNNALSKLPLMRSFDRKDLTELAMHAIDKQIEDIISNQDYLLIGDEDLLEIIKRDTLNISNEFDLFKMVFDYSIRKYPNIVHQKKDDQKKDDQKKDDPKISLNDKSRDLLNNTFLNHIRFGSMGIEDIEFIREKQIFLEKGDEKINDILDFIENFADGDNKDNIRIIQKYQNQKIDWFKSKRHFFDEKLFDLTKELNLESNLIKIEKLNLPITKNCFFATYDSAILKWIDKEICDKLKLQFVSDSNDNYSCKEFHEICDNQGPIVVIIKSEGYIFGGFSSVGWIKNQNQNQNQNPYFIEDDKAFLFTLKSKNEEQQILKVIPEQKETALVYYSKRGPIFGDGWDLSISGNLKSGFSNLGLNYQLPDDIQYNSKKAKSFFTNRHGEWKIERIEVYF